jgi:hypothetical protein
MQLEAGKPCAFVFFISMLFAPLPYQCSSLSGHILTYLGDMIYSNIVSAFWTRGVRKPTSKFVAACPYPDGLARDGTQGENAARIISH